jgi:hypothetical protein
MLRTRKEKTRGADVEEEVELEQVQLHVQEEEEVAEVLFPFSAGLGAVHGDGVVDGNGGENPLSCSQRDGQKKRSGGGEEGVDELGFCRGCCEDFIRRASEGRPSHQEDSDVPVYGFAAVQEEGECNAEIGGLLSVEQNGLGAQWEGYREERPARNFWATRACPAISKYFAN